MRILNKRELSQTGLDFAGRENQRSTAEEKVKFRPQVKLVKLWLLAVILAVCGTAAVASCTANDDNPSAVQPTVQRIQKRGKLLVGTTGDYRPLSYREADGNYWGFGIEMAEKMAERIGVGIEFVHTSWPTLTADVLAEPQTFDLAIGGITITDARRETMLMSDGYLANGKTILFSVSPCTQRV
jgi:cyclohexadienyl dehydratase